MTIPVSLLFTFATSYPTTQVKLELMQNNIVVKTTTTSFSGTELNYVWQIENNISTGDYIIKGTFTDGVCNGAVFTSNSIYLVGTITSNIVSYVSGNNFFVEEGDLKIAFSLKFGGVISHFSTKTGKNLINTFDAGRYNGISFYADPKEYFPEGAIPSVKFYNAGWNPVQAGGANNNGSAIIQPYVWNPILKTFTVNIHPLQYKFTNAYFDNETQMQAVYTIDGANKTVKCVYNYGVNRQNLIIVNPYDYDETPFMYLTRDLYNVKYYKGTNPWTNAPLTDLVYSAQAQGLNTPEKWVHCTNGSGDDFGFYTPTSTDGYFVLTQQGNTSDGVADTSNSTMIVQAVSVYENVPIWNKSKTAYFSLLNITDFRAFVYSKK